jgi:hypothetical protein
MWVAEQRLFRSAGPKLISFFGAFATLRKADTNFVIYVRPHGTALPPLEGFFMKFDI